MTTPRMRHAWWLSSWSTTSSRTPRGRTDELPTSPDSVHTGDSFARASPPAETCPTDSIPYTSSNSRGASPGRSPPAIVPFAGPAWMDEDLVVEPDPEPGEWATVPGTGSTSSEHRKRLRKQRRDRDHYLYFGAGKSTEFPFGTSGTELLLDVRRPLGDVHPHLSVNSNVVLPDGDLGFWDFENPSGDVGAYIDAVLRSIPPSQHLAGEEAKVWIASGVFSYRRLTWPDDRKFLLVSEDWKTSRYLPRLRGRALKPETADWFLGLETLQREGLLDAIEYGPKGVFFDAGGRTLSVGSEPPPPGQIQAVLGRLRTLIGLGHDFACRDVATLTQDPCVIRIDAADPDGGKLTSLRREIDARRITNPMVFTTQGDLATSLDRLSAWPYWESFEAKVDGSILQGAGEERGKSITRMLDGLVIGQGGRRSIVVRIFHNEGDFLEGLIAEAVAGKFAGQYLVVGGCPMDYGKLLELQSVAISKGALGVVAPFMEFVNPEAIP